MTTNIPLCEECGCEGNLSCGRKLVPFEDCTLDAHLVCPCCQNGINPYRPENKNQLPLYPETPTQKEWVEDRGVLTCTVCGRVEEAPFDINDSCWEGCAGIFKIMEKKP